MPTEEIGSYSMPTEEIGSYSMPTEEIGSYSMPTEEIGSYSMPTEEIGSYSMPNLKIGISSTGVKIVYLLRICQYYNYSLLHIEINNNMFISRLLLNNRYDLV
jgi:hypothetical protein